MTFETKTLGTVAQYVNGRAFKPDEWEEKGLPIIRIQNLTNPNAKYNYSSAEFEEKYLVNKGDLLFAWSASLGAHIWKQGSAWLNQHIFKVIPNNDVDRDYLYYYLLKVVAELYQKAHGTGMVHITKAPFMATTIPIPDLNSQRKIVLQIEESLSQLDSAVETLKKTKQQLEVYRQAVLKEAFSFESAEQIVEVSQITDSIRIGPFGTTLHKSDYVNDGIPVINPQHIKNGVIVPSSKNSISVEKAKELSNYQLKTNDIIMGRRGEMGRSAPVTENENGWICGTGSIFFRLKSGFDAVLYSKILSSPKVVHYLEENATGTTMKNLNEDIVSHIPVPFIDKSKQQQIMQRLEEQLSECDNIERSVNQSLQQAEALRQSILKQAFEGNNINA